MLFHTPSFLVFFVAYFALQIAVPLRHRLWLILIGGSAFYAYWNPWLLWLPHLLALIGWAGALWVAAAAGAGARRWRLAVSAALLLFPLLFFKYTTFVYQQILRPVLDTPDWSLPLPLPLGISFVTFTMMAYLVDCYRAVYPVERRARMVSAYMVFFPHLIAGPILRPRELMPQLDRPRPALRVNAVPAILIFTLGLAKKVIFANQLADPVNRVYAGGTGLTSLDYALAIYGFSLQIYCDFSGYTDMAIGLALMLGVKLPNNFSRPYGSASVAESWRAVAPAAQRDGDHDPRRAVARRKLDLRPLGRRPRRLHRAQSPAGRTRERRTRSRRALARGRRYLPRGDPRLDPVPRRRPRHRLARARRAFRARGGSR